MDSTKDSSVKNVDNSDKKNGCSVILLMTVLFLVFFLTIIPKIVDSYYILQGSEQVGGFQDNISVIGNIGNIWNVIFLAAIYFLLSVIIPFFSCKYVKNHNKIIFESFDKRWLPEKNKEAHKIRYGDKLEKVAISDYESTTGRALVTEIIPRSLIVGLLLGVFMIFVLTYFIKIPLKTSFLFSLVFGLSINVMTSMFFYLIAEWVRTRSKVVVFTTCFYVVKVRANFVHYFTHRSLAKAQRTKMEEVKEIKNARDAEDLGLGLKTGWLTEWFTSKNPNALSIYVASFREGVSDVLYWMEDGYGLLDLLTNCQVEAEKIIRSRGIIEAKAVELEYGDPIDKNWTKAKGQQAAKEYLDRLPIKEVVYDVYRAENPSSNSNETHSENLTQKVEVSYENVSSHFSKINPLRR